MLHTTIHTEGEGKLCVCVWGGGVCVWSGRVCGTYNEHEGQDDAQNYHDDFL